jgi:glycogen synthase
VNGNGFTFDPFDEHELATRLLKMTALSDDERKQLAEAGYAIAANFAPDRFGEGLEQAATMAAKDARRTIGVMDRALLVASARFGT